MKLSRISGVIALVLAIVLIAGGILGSTFKDGAHSLSKAYASAAASESAMQKHADAAGKTAPSAVKKAETAVKQAQNALDTAQKSLDAAEKIFEGYQNGSIDEQLIRNLMDSSAALDESAADLQNLFSDDERDFSALAKTLSDISGDIRVQADKLTLELLKKEFDASLKAVNNAESKVSAALKGISDVYARSDLEYAFEDTAKTTLKSPSSIDGFVPALETLLNRAQAMNDAAAAAMEEAARAQHASKKVSAADSLSFQEKLLLLVGKAYIFVTLTGIILAAAALIMIFIPHKFAYAWKHVPVFSTFITAIVMIIILTYAHGNTMNFAFTSYADWGSKWLVNMLNVLRANASVGMVALGMTFVIITGGIDLAVGSTLAGVATVVMVVLDVSQSGFFTARGITGSANFLLAIGMGLASGLILGGLTGVGVAKGRIPPFIVTLGIMNIVRSVAQYFTKSTKIEVPTDFQFLANAKLSEILNAIAKIFNKNASVAFPKGFAFLGDLMLLPIIYWIILAVITHVISKHTAFGRHIYAVGSNERTSRLSGINVDRVKISVYMLMGLIVAIAAITQVARLRGVDVASAGTGLEMSAIAAVVVGGTSMSGGRGSIIGTVLGVLIIGIMDTLVILLHIDAFLSNAFIGAIIIFAVLMQRKEK